MNGITLPTVAMMVAAVVAQLAGGMLLPATKGFTAPLPTAACLFGVGLGGFLLSRLMAQGAPLSLLIPLSAVMLQIVAVLVGVFIYHEPASLARISLLVIASVIVGVSSVL